VGEADDGGLGDFRVATRALSTSRFHAVAGDVYHVVDAAGDPVIPVLVTPGAVASEVETFEGGK